MDELSNGFKVLGAAKSRRLTQNIIQGSFWNTPVRVSWMIFSLLISWVACLLAGWLTGGLVAMDVASELLQQQRLFVLLSIFLQPFVPFEAPTNRGVHATCGICGNWKESGHDGTACRQLCRHPCHEWTSVRLRTLASVSCTVLCDVVVVRM